ncbi:MAG TPA: hypothetical protein VG013_28590 [Gemmataceae bacterium]|nr:hypothetical protein [Gemmataceae bacterium]
MVVTEYMFAALIVLVLVGLAGYFGWREWQVLRGLRDEENLPPDDRRYLRRQAWRRLVCCGLMAVLAGLFVGWYALGFHQQALDWVEGRGPQGPPEREVRLLNLSLAYVGAAGVVLIGMLLLAAFDLWAIRRFGIRHLRQIQADRRAMIERQAARLRSRRNGQGE